MIVAMVALIAAVGGTAYAAKKITYKGLDKEARLKVLPFSKTATGTNCNPTAAGTYVDCATVNVDGSTGFPRKYYIAFTGTFDGVGGVSRGDCRLEADNAPIAGTTIRIETPTHTGRARRGLRHQHRHRAAGREAHDLGGLQRERGRPGVHQFQLSAFQVR